MVRYFLMIFCLNPLLSLSQDWDFGPLRKLPPNINSQFEEVLPMQSPDGKTLFFSRAACPDNVGGEFAGTDVWVSKYDETTLNWGKPQNEKTFNGKGTNAV